MTTTILIDEKNIYEIIGNIRTLHQTTVNQRPYNLTEYLVEVFQFIKKQLHIDLSKVFGSLTNLLRNYDDRAALKIEFIKGNCLTFFYDVLTGENSHKANIVSILDFVAEILVNSDNVQETFLNFDGYRKFFGFLSYVHSPTLEFINRLLILMTEKSSLQMDSSLTPVDIFVQLANPLMAVALIYWIPHLDNVQHQRHIIHTISIIASRSLQNKMVACSNNIIYSLIDILFSKKLTDKELIDTIFSIVEKLSRFSINRDEICLIYQLFNEDTIFKKQLLRVLITAAKHDDPDMHGISSYFDLQRSNSGIIIPATRRWPSLSSSSLHFSFHCWIRVNNEIETYPYHGRRQVYSICFDSFSLECFIHHSSLYVSVSDRRELAYNEVHECDELMDGCWHSLTIVHTAQRPSLLVSAFQNVSSCCLTIYIDGFLKKQIKDFKYVYLLNEPISLASVGAPSQRPRPLLTNSRNDASQASSSSSIAKTMQPLRSLFSLSKSKTNNSRSDYRTVHGQNTITVEPDSLDSIIGESTGLHGQLALIWILAETLTEVQVKHIHSMGADFCHQRHSALSGDTAIASVILDLLATRSVLVYHPLACNGQTCVDISTPTSQMNGRLNNGACLRLRPFSESLLNIGGCPVLYPLLEKFLESDYVDASQTIENASPTTNFESPTDWIIVRKSSQKNLSDIDNRLISNPIASAINLIRCVLLSTSATSLAEQMTKNHNVEILGYHLKRISPLFIDQQLLIAVQQLIECSRLNQSTNLLTNQLIQYILLDFSLWNKAKYDVRISHLQFLLSIIKDDRKNYRNKFGVQYFLDVIRQHFNTTDEDTDEGRNLRSAVYGIMKYYVQRHLRIEELNALISAISTLSVVSDAITRELLEFILALIDPPISSTDATIGLLCEPNMTESFYSLLTINRLTTKTKEVVVKIIKCLVASKRVPQQVRTQLRLESNHIGFGGIISDFEPSALSVSIVREILNLIIHNESSIDVEQLNIVLTLCSSASLDVRYVAMRKLMTCFIGQPMVCRSYAKCHGWQETLAHFFVKTRRLSPIQSRSLVDFSASLHRDTSASSLNTYENHQTSSIVSPLARTSSVVDDSFYSHSSPRPSVASNSACSATVTFNDGKDATPEFLQRSDDFQENTIHPTLSFQPSLASRDDLASLATTENSADDFGVVANNNYASSTMSKSTANTSVTSTEDTTDFVASVTNPEDAGLLEELCETLLLTIVMVLWKGIINSDDEAWNARGQLFSALRHLHRDHEFYLPLVYIERRLLELTMETCLNDLKVHGVYRSYDRLNRRRISETRKTTSAFDHNCRELIKLADDFLSQSTDADDRITENFINGILPLLDTMLIFEESGSGDQNSETLVSHDEHWTETSLTGLNILLNLLAHPNVQFCGPASVRINSLLHSRPISGREEAAYLLSSVNKIFMSLTKSEDNDHVIYILTVMKTIIHKSYDILQMNVQIPNVPLHKATATALDDFREYISLSSDQEWQTFMQKHIEPLAENYRSMSTRPFHMNMTIWWNNCHEKMMIGKHKRSRQIGEEKLKFQSHIVEQWRSRRRSDQQRFLQLAKQASIRQVQVEKEWKNREKYIRGARGPWSDPKTNKERYWMLSNRENIHRMRCKLIENENFDTHEEASRLRDNCGADLVHECRSLLIGESLKNKSVLIQQEIIHGTVVDQDELLAVENETKLLLLEEKEKMIIGSQCSLITPTSVTSGKLEITNRYIYFFDHQSNSSFPNDFKYPLSWLKDVHLRRHNLRPSALEFFLINQTNFLINFDKKLRRQIYQKIVSMKLPGMKRVSSHLSVTTTPSDILKESKFTEKWVNREMSNFDYLMMLNTIAGRTYNDLNQYPVFPWILKDYKSETLDLKDPSVFRDLSKPIGIQNPKHIEDVRAKYESFDDPTGLMKKCHYCTHYSNAASVMHYLIRMEPFATLHIQLQSGKFDIADRQFHSFQSAWTNIMDSSNEVKELIPEFFYLPECLVNSNKFDLGKLQITDQSLNNVQLPPWAHSSPEEFIRIHRAALESDYVSSHLHEWIDLIFGYKQTGQSAIDALNIFMYCSYENAVDVDAIEDPVTREAIEGMIQNFGQIPSQLLTEPHPKRLTSTEASFEAESQGRPMNIFQNLANILAFFVEITPADEKSCDPITYVSIPKDQVRSFMQQGIPDALITVSVTGVVGNNGWQPYDRSLSSSFTFERDPTLQTERNRHMIGAPFSPSTEINSRLFAVSHDAKFVYSGGHWDWSLRVYSLAKTKIINSLVHHTDVITCVALDSTGYILVTGSRDTTCVIWNISSNDSLLQNNPADQESNSLISPASTLYGHTLAVTCVCVSTELDLVASGSLDGTCNIYTVENGVYVRTLRPMVHRIVGMQLSNERHILIHAEKQDTHLFLYSINGDLIQAKKMEYKVVDMLLSDQHIVLAANHTPLVSQTRKAKDNAASRVIIKDMFEMKTIQAIRLRTHIRCLYLTKDFSHLLVGVADGKLIVLTAKSKSSSKSNQT